MLRLNHGSAPGWFVCGLLAAALAGCVNVKDEGSRAGGAQIIIDGSSTVFPITRGVAEQFRKQHPEVEVPVASSGTGGGFKRFTKGETAINDASRPIKEAEMEQCKKNKIEYLELKIALDGLSVVVNKENTWCDCLTVDQLKKLWEPDSKIILWRQLNPEWPDKPIKLYGADSDSGTFDYFTEAICGKEKASRTDYTASADDTVLVAGVEGEKHSLGYFGYAYYLRAADRLKVVAIKASDDAECIQPEKETIETGRYKPLSRPLFIYVNKAKLHQPEVAAFCKFYLNEGQALVPEVGYVSQSGADLEASRKALEDALAGAK